MMYGHGNSRRQLFWIWGLAWLGFLSLGPFASWCSALQLTIPEPEVTKAAEQLTSQISAWDALGPLAPVALSPFFGLACLSGLATYGPDWLQQRSGLLQEASPLNNPGLFGIMVLLTVVTSLPRLTKVSKPIALIAENLETYSVAIIFLAMRMAPMFSDRGPDAVAMEASLVVAGFPGTSLPVDLLLGIVSALNIIVINMVKLSCEFFIWLIPFPAVDALFELANKSVSATLMAIYCYSPVAAAFLNFIILGVCLLMFDTVWRRVRFCRGILLEPLLARIFPSWYPQSPSSFDGYLAKPFGGFSRCSRVHVTSDAGGWRVTARGWWKKLDKHMNRAELQAKKTLVVDIVTIRSPDGDSVEVFRRK